MTFALKDKVVVITGAASGIGYSIADHFLRKGAKTVVILDINENNGTEAAAKLNANYGNNKAVFMKCDVTKDLNDVSETIIRTYKTVDVLVNNAGILNELDSKKTMDLNALAVIDWSLKFWEHMRADKGGKGGTIINMSSICGLGCREFIPIYQASKFAVVGFTGSLGHAYNFNRSGVRVMAICPGLTVTPILSDFVLWDGLNEDFVAYMNSLPSQTADDVGKAAVEIFENESSGNAWIIEGAVLTKVELAK